MLSIVFKIILQAGLSVFDFHPKQWVVGWIRWTTC